MDFLPRLIVLGQLTRDFILTHEVASRADIPGGDAIFSAAGMRFWDEKPGVCARIGEMYPQKWLEAFKANNIDTLGIVTHPEVPDIIRFFRYTSIDSFTQDDPISHYAQLGIPIPKALLGYVNPVQQTDSQTQTAIQHIRSYEVPPAYLDAIAAHLCPLDYVSYTTLLHALHQGSIHTISMDPGEGIMNSLYYTMLPNLVRDANIFHTSEAKIRQLFLGRTEDIWEMAEQIGCWGAEIVVIRSGNQGQYVLDYSSKKRWILSAYPSHVVDPTGAGAVFCGGFLAGYLQHYDPLLACLKGSISASFAVEGSGPLYIMDTLPGLAERRLEKLQETVRLI